MTVPRNVNRLRGAKALGRAPGTVTAVTLHDWRVTGAAQTRADLVASIVNKQFPTAGSRAALLREARELAHPRAGALVTIQSWVPEGARSNKERRLARALAKLSIIVVLNYRIGPYRFDLVHVGARLFIEFDSKHFHADIRAFRSDRARRNIAVQGLGVPPVPRISTSIGASMWWSRRWPPPSASGWAGRGPSPTGIGRHVGSFTTTCAGRPGSPLRVR